MPAALVLIKAARLPLRRSGQRQRMRLPLMGDPFLNYFALFALVFVVVVLFYGIIAIHDIPAKIAESRHHPHQDAIHAAGWVSLSRISAPNSRTASSRLPCSPLAALPVAPSRLLPRFQPRS